MAAANESQGLKIAVAAFITLTVILTVSSYFLYTNGASAEAKQQSAEETLRTKTKAAERRAQPVRHDAEQDRRQGQLSIDPANEEINAHMKKVGERLDRASGSGERRRPEGPAERRAGPRARRGQAERPEGHRIAPIRAEQDLHLVARPHRRS